MMHFIVYSEVTAATIATSMGKPEYSYYFVLKEFLPLLKSLGKVSIVERPELEVDPIYAKVTKAGGECFFLSFSPPHKTVIGLKCPTIPVFAWEFDSLPDEVWLNDQRNDWRHGLGRFGRAIVHSLLTKNGVHQLMGNTFPVESIPAPLWDRMASVRDSGNKAGQSVTLTLRNGVVIDTQTISLEPYRPAPDAVARFLEAAKNVEEAASAESQNADVLPTPTPAFKKIALPARQSIAHITLRYLVEFYRVVIKDMLARYRNTKYSSVPTQQPHLEPPPPPTVYEAEIDERFRFKTHTLQLNGVIFTAVFNPYDGRKNWEDMLTAFCTAFSDTEDAVLLFKLTHQEYYSAMQAMLMCMGRLPPFKCRVILVQGFFDQHDYQSLMGVTAYVLNASHGEGQCLPLMEYMSCGKPAIAPRNSAMLDYIDTEVGFVVNSWLDATAWPHDPRLAYRTCRHQLDWASLTEAFSQAYETFKQQPDRYKQLSMQAINRMREHCSQAVARERLRRLLASASENINAVST